MRFGILLALAFFLSVPVLAQEKDEKASFVLHKALVYGKGGTENLELDLALPANVDGKTPAIVCLHGGGWRSGHRHDLSRLIEFLAQKGFVAVTASYRLSPTHAFPAQIEDCKAAVRWLRANAGKYRVDPLRIGCVGFSAGGHLACLLGTADKEAGFEGNGGSPDQSSRVQAVVSFYGPTDFTIKRWDKRIEDFFLAPFLGGPFEEKKELYRQASPLQYASKDDPPFLFFHGAKDNLVTVEESRKLSKKLHEVGVSARLEILDKEGHGWSGAAMRRTVEQSAAFFEEMLKK